MDIAIIVIYLVAMLAFGWWGKTRTKNSSDFLVAGRRLGPMLYTGTMAAVVLGGASTVGGVGLGYKYGISGMWLVVAIAVGLLVLSLVFGLAVQELVREFFETFETQVGATDHQQWGDQPRDEHADRQRRRHQDQFVDERTLCHRPNDGDFPLRAYAGDLLGIERQVVAEHAGGLLGSHFGHQRNVVQNGGDVVDQHQQTASCHESCFLLCMNVAKHNATAGHRLHC